MTDEPESSQESSEVPEVAAVPQTPPPDEAAPETVEAEIEQAVATVTAAADVQAASVRPVQFGTLREDGVQEEGGGNLDLLLDVEIPISVEVGRASMVLNEILDLVPGSIVRLDKKSEDPLDLRVNGKLVARGEVVMVDDNYGLRITQIVDAAGRIESLR